MQKWELTTKLVDISKVAIGGPRPELSKLWTEKNKKTGKTEWDVLQELANDGWELVSVTPITYGGGTGQVLYTFKRLKVDKT